MAVALIVLASSGTAQMHGHFASKDSTEDRLAAYGPLQPHLRDYAAIWQGWSATEQAAYVEGYKGAVVEIAAWQWPEATGVVVEEEVRTRLAIQFNTLYFHLRTQPTDPLAARVQTFYADSRNAILPISFVVDVAARTPLVAAEERLSRERQQVLEMAQHWYDHNHEM